MSSRLQPDPFRGALWRAAATPLVLVGMAGCATTAHPPMAQVWVTTADRSRLLARDADQRFTTTVPLQVLDDEAAARHVTGIAWHCYGGHIDAQMLVHTARPDYSTLLTECSGGEWQHSWAEALQWFGGTMIIENARNWGSGTILWNLALDEHHGPHLGGCNNCRGVVTRNVEYYSLAHLGRFVRPGARRVESTSDVDGLISAAFRNSDDGSVALLVFNTATGALPTFAWQAH